MVSAFVSILVVLFILKEMINDNKKKKNQNGNFLSLKLSFKLFCRSFYFFFLTNSSVVETCQDLLYRFLCNF